MPVTGKAQHLHTYFLFPFSMDKEAVVQDYPHVWKRGDHWIDGLDTWVGQPEKQDCAVVRELGAWKRDPYRTFDMSSAAYQDMVFFHPFVRRVFFDTGDAYGGQQESLLRCYQIALKERELRYEAEDQRGRSASLEVTDLRLFLFANGIGILSIGVQASGIPLDLALWVNEMMRKVYPSSRRQMREGRAPKRMALSVGGADGRKTVAEETFDSGTMIGYQPPLSKLITGLLYFTNYGRQEFEPVLDERMIVYTHLAVDPASVPEGYRESSEYQVLISRLLYVDRWGGGFRYEPEFSRASLRRDLYTRWAHQGTYYGFTSYSNVTVTVGQFTAEDHKLEEGFLIHRMFDARYYLTVVVALFYRATLLDFSERTALVSGHLYRKYSAAVVGGNDIRVVSQLMAEFQHFCNYWYFSELANKDEEIEHFQMQCAAYRLEPMKLEVEQEIEKLKATIDTFYQLRNTEAVNRLAMLSMILGGGAMVTGFFGMNFGSSFEKLFFNPPPGADWAHRFSISAVALMTVGALLFGIYLVTANWSDYKTILLPARMRGRQRPESLRRVIEHETGGENPPGEA